MRWFAIVAFVLILWLQNCLSRFLNHDAVNLIGCWIGGSIKADAGGDLKDATPTMDAENKYLAGLLVVASGVSWLKG